MDGVKHLVRTAGGSGHGGFRTAFTGQFGLGSGYLRWFLAHSLRRASSRTPFHATFPFLIAVAISISFSTCLFFRAPAAWCGSCWITRRQFSSVRFGGSFRVCFRGSLLCVATTFSRFTLVLRLDRVPRLRYCSTWAGSLGGCVLRYTCTVYPPHLHTFPPPSRRPTLLNTCIHFALHFPISPTRSTAILFTLRCFVLHLLLLLFTRFRVYYCLYSTF